MNRSNTHTNITNDININTNNNTKIPDLHRRVKQALYMAKEDNYEYQEEYETGINMLHELIQNDEFVDDNARQLIIDTLEPYNDSLEEKSPFKYRLVSKLLYQIKHQHD